MLARYLAIGQPESTLQTTDEAATYIQRPHCVARRDAHFGFAPGILRHYKSNFCTHSGFAHPTRLTRTKRRNGRLKPIYLTISQAVFYQSAPAKFLAS